MLWRKIDISYAPSVMPSGAQIMLHRGTQLVRQNSSNSTPLSQRQFISFFGVPPNTVFRIWERINSQVAGDYLYDHLLITLDFLFNYNTQSRACLQFNLSEPTYRNIIWDGVHKLRKMNVVRQFNFHRNFNIFLSFC